MGIDRKEIEEVVRQVLRESGHIPAKPQKMPSLKDTPVFKPALPKEFDKPTPIPDEKNKVTPYWKPATLAGSKPYKKERKFGKAPPSPEEQNEAHRKFWEELS